MCRNLRRNTNSYSTEQTLHYHRFGRIDVCIVSFEDGTAPKGPTFEVYDYAYDDVL